MNENLSSNKTKNDDCFLNTEVQDYKNLVTRLREISSKIALLEKRYLDKF